MAGPGADLRANATPIVLGDVSITPTDGLTHTPGDSAYGYYAEYGTAWWSFSPTTSGFVTLSTSGSTAGLDPTLRVYLANADITIPSALLHIDHDNGGSLQSYIKMQVVAGRTYHIVAGFEDPPAAGAQLKLTLSERKLADQPQATPLGLPKTTEEHPSHLRLSPDGTRVAALVCNPVHLGGANKYYDWKGEVVVYDLELPELIEVARFQVNPYRTGLGIDASHEIFRLMWNNDGSALLVSDGTNVAVCNLNTATVGQFAWPAGSGCYGYGPAGDGFVAIGIGSTSPYPWSRVDISASGAATWSALPLSGSVSLHSLPLVTTVDWVNVSSSQTLWYRFDGTKKTFSFRTALGDPNGNLSYWTYGNGIHRTGDVVWFLATADYTGGMRYLCWVNLATDTAGKFDISEDFPKVGSFSYFSQVASIDANRMGVVHIRDSNRMGVVAAIDVSGATPVVSDRSYLGDSIHTGAPRYVDLGDFKARGDVTPDWVYVSRIGENDDATADRERWYITNLTSLDPPPLAALRETRRRFV